MFLELLNLSRLDAQVVKPTIEVFAIATVLSRLSVEFAPQAQAKDVEFQADSSDAWVSSDMALVEQILSNLIANAVRYTDKGRITIACGDHGQNLRVEVRDTGIGISPAQQKNVFDEFCQIGNTNRDITKGLGLGLAIVKRLCTLLDVPISVDSVVGQGSIFAIELPRAAPRASEAGEHSAPRRLQDALNGKLVVVVDDDDSILDAMRILLEQWGSSVVTAKSAREVSDFLGHSRRCPDVLVCDYRLRLSETGLDVIEKLRSEFNQEILAILITGDTAPALLQDTLSSGLTVLHKPVQADALYRALEQLLSRQS
jgi:CheY-like chemotaxis protein/anti-sigma regulatory factor (Ser/Thr protein kinase)